MFVNLEIFCFIFKQLIQLSAANLDRVNLSMQKNGFYNTAILNALGLYEFTGITGTTAARG